VATGIVLVLAGMYILVRQRRVLLLTAGVLWLAGDVWDGLLYAHRGPLTQLVLGRSPVTALAYIDGLIPPLARSPWPTLVLVCAVIAAAARRGSAAPLAAAVAVGGALAYESVGTLAGFDSNALAAWWYDVAVAISGAGAAVEARSRPAGAVAADLVVDLAATPQTVRPALARALRDPTIDVAYRVASGWVDESGRPVQLPQAGNSRRIRLVDDAVALVHDPAALNDPALARSVDGALRLTLATVRVQAEVGERVREVEQSRRRLVEAGAVERHRLREHVRRGAERHLEAASVALAHAPDCAELRADLTSAREELRRFARGIHPPALTELGLGAALGELVRQWPRPVHVNVPHGRFPEAQETVTYFICAEALANAAKYAPEARVEIKVTVGADRLHVRVEDDGPGGANPARGSGLRGLADRAEALGGRLVVQSPMGGGTRLEADLPVTA
jgi:hypothetical protein